MGRVFPFHGFGDEYAIKARLALAVLFFRA